MTTYNDRGNDVAIVAMAGRFPGAANVEQFWHNLVNGIESIERFGPSADEPSTPIGSGNIEVKAAARLKDVDLFDAGFFGFSAREAELMDPQHRLFLECAVEAFERAGHDPERFAGLVGVYAGMGASTYLRHVLRSVDEGEAALALQAFIGNDKDYLATTLSYKLNLHGPSVTVQTACSTALVAAHLACQALLDYECDMALAGGVSIRSPQPLSYLYYPGGVLSPDGYCRAFDSSAQGTLFGNGLGAVILRRLDDALDDGDTVHAVIRGSAINNDGSAKVGYTAPSIRGQVAMVTTALARASVDPATIGYVEAHGTGTSIGDPIEVTALTEAFRTHTAARGFCGLGSVKTNVGHLDTAAGIAGLIKTVLALEHRTLPPTLHFRQPNPRLGLEESPFYVVTETRPWDGPAPLRAAVTALGIGGTNAHLILEEAPAVLPSQPTRLCHLVPLSARSAGALDEATDNLAAHLDAHGDLGIGDVAWTLQTGRRAWSHRRVVVSASVEEASRALASRDHRVVTGTHDGPAPSVRFILPGAGSHHVNMAGDLYRTEPLFRTYFDECIQCLPRDLGSELMEVLYPDPAHEAEAARRLQQGIVGLPLLFAVEYSLARLLISWGVRPDAMIGHSLGEYAAACLAGVFSLPDALALVVYRAQLMDTVANGSMLSVAMHHDELLPLLPPDVSVAAINAPGLCVLSGATASIDRLAAGFAANGVEARRILAAVAGHSPMLDPVLDQFGEFVARLPRKVPQTRFVSGVTGTWITEAEATSVEYWVRHLRQTVRFAEGVSTLLEEPSAVLVDVGPGTAFGALARQQPGAADRLILSAMRHPQAPDSDTHVLLGALGRLWIAGVPVDWEAHRPAERPRRVVLPTYPFERTKYWIGADGTAPAERRGDRRQPIDDWCYAPAWRQSVAGDVLPSRALPAEGSWVVFCDPASLGEAVVQRLAVQGQRVISVATGDAFRQISTDSFVIDPHREDDYDLLFAALDRKHPPHTIVHLWHVADGNASLAAAEPPDAAAATFTQMLFLARALHRQGIGGVHVAVGASRLAQVWSGDARDAVMAPLVAACRVMPQEYAGLTTRWIDVLPPRTPPRRRRVAQALAHDLYREPAGQAIAYRGTQRWVQGYDRVPVRRGKPPLKENGVYLITGGLGALGLILARHLASTYNARLVLAGRTALPARERWAEWLGAHADDDHASTVLRTLMDFESRGIDALTLQADVASQADIDRMLEDAYERFGAVDGVFHLAGVPGGGVMQLKSADAVGAVFTPKVSGSYRIVEACGRRRIPFVVLFSSITAVVGGVGQSDYCAASMFMDALAGSRGATDVIAIHWDAWQADRWQDAALAQFPEIRERSRQWRSRFGIRAVEGMDVLERLLGAHLSRAVVSVQDLSVASEGMDRASARAAGARATSTPREATRTPGAAFVAPATDTEKRVAAVWERVLGVSGISAHDTFIGLGGHSLLMLQVVARLRLELEADVPVRALFEHPTIADLARFIDTAAAGPPTDEADNQELASLLAEVESLTPEQVRQELAALDGAETATRPE